MVEYRTPRPEEAAEVARLGEETFVETFGHLYGAEDLAAFVAQVYSPETVAAEMANAKLRYQVAEVDGHLVGLCKVGIGVTLDYDPGDRHVVELKQLYIRQSTLGSGVGQTLMDWALEQAAQAAADEMILSVYSDNPRAQRFYERNGFAKIADTFFMVGNHRDEEFLYMRPMS
jgi:ribosomal protein S18 acetylase RimI-like enzyme